MRKFHICKDDKDMAEQAALRFAELAENAVSRRGVFTVALSGGSTPKRLFERLAAPPYRSDIPWESTVCFWGDDRAVSPDHKWSNYRMAREALLDRVSIPPERTYPIRGELGAASAAQRLTYDLENVFGTSGTPRFDLAIMGMGPDGHTASLFPDTYDPDTREWVAAVPVPMMEPRVERITMTLPVFNQARSVIFLVCGTDKRSVVAEIMDDPEAESRYPAARVAGENTVWFLDESAAG